MVINLTQDCIAHITQRVLLLLLLQHAGIYGSMIRSCICSVSSAEFNHFADEQHTAIKTATIKCCNRLP